QFLEVSVALDQVLLLKVVFLKYLPFILLMTAQKA
ncbi:hypothetical protein X975_08056, partial [Stegodyphus mimosarum]